MWWMPWNITDAVVENVTAEDWATRVSIINNENAGTQTFFCCKCGVAWAVSDGQVHENDYPYIMLVKITFGMGTSLFIEHTERTFHYDATAQTVTITTDVIKHGFTPSS